jgi:molybdopterin-guanine dinucleotide biosynthesis protein A
VRYSFSHVSQYDAILPAGGQIDAEFAAKVGTDRKALIQLGGHTILRNSLECLQATGRFNRLVLIGPEDVAQSDSAKLATHRVPERSSGPDNIMAGLEALEKDGGPTNKVVVLTTDLPFLTKEVLLDFLDRSPQDLEIVIPVCTKTEYQKAFPDSTSTYMTLKDESYTAGGAFLMDPQALRRAMPMIDRLFANRKSKIGMARLLGPALLFKYLAKTITIDDVERKALSLMGIKGNALRDAPPQLAYDIDDLEDYEYALAHLQA